MDKQPDARPANSENRARVNVAHDRELFQVMRLAVNVGADVEENCGFAFLRGQNCG